ncbi:MAG: glycoside hydrolase family 99-like domain-containing protein [Phycisphaerae bacterium]|nr:glycoside hydrolase family 99-like domain-containing protein [Phycisphaerae bacterium]
MANPDLAQMLNSAAPAPRKDFDVAVINYAGYHPTPFMEAWHGFGWSEWDILARSRPRFPGHRQPLEPLWGEYDDSDPAFVAREIDAMADHGIDAVIYDWYWYCGTEMWNEGLDRGFLHAPNRSRMKFGLMWANHTWQNNHPAELTEALTNLIPIRHSPEDCDRVIDAWTERYFSQPNYWRIDGRPWVSFFLLSSLMDHLGGKAGVGRAVERMRKRAEKNGQPGLHLGLFTWSAGEAKTAREVGFDHVTTYNYVRGANQQAGQPLVDYADVMAGHVSLWKSLNESGVPYWPVVTHGWDVSPRVHPYEPWPPVRWAWPWGHIITGNTPDRFGQLVTAARRFLATQSNKPKVMVINAWNEWTEGSVLAPTKDEGYGILEALRAALA